MDYKTFADLSQAIKANLHKIPHDVSLVVGVPRSGLLAANLMSLYLNVPITDIDNFTKGEVLTTGFRFLSLSEKAYQGRILIVDDIINTGRTITEAKEKLMAMPEISKYNISYCSVYVQPGKEDMVDIPLVSMDKPCVFEWNVFHENILSKACVDIDGVVCDDPKESENDDGELYTKFILTARPKFTPKFKIRSLVTSRLEKYRTETEEWLRTNGIDFEELIMLDLPDKATRVRLNSHGSYKANEYKKRKDAVLFIESERGQAQKIFELTGKNVYCVDTKEMYTHETYPVLTLNASKKTGGYKTRTKKIVKKLLARFK